ncbi:MAG TPA: HAMP domain-containing sensor histidine kinase [Labilithrix sp.]
MQAVDALVAWSEELVRRQAPTPPPTSEASAETARLALALDSLVRRLFDALERERAQSAYIAHELRTPLTAMRAELEALASREPIAARIIEDVDQLSRSLDAILVLAQPREAQTADAIVNLADLARDLAPKAVVIDAPDEALVHGDEALLALAMRNIIENADKHGGGATHLAVRRDGALVEVAVCDGGVGLRADELRRVFEPHWRASTSASGTGLGLALVAAVAARHGGEADARPNPAGRGLEVRLRIGALVAWHE